MDMIIDRRHTDAMRAVAAAWLAFLVGLLVGGEIGDAGSLAIAAASAAAVVVVLGFAAAWRCRSLPTHTTAERLRLTLLSLALGTALGLANLAANWVIAAMHPTFRALLDDRMTTLDPLVGLVASPLIEEILVRLFLLSVIAWMVWRLTNQQGLAFAIALFASALVFAALHLDRPMPQDGLLANYYRVALLTKYTLAGLPLGWVFWRWGLPYAILCHVAANAAHLAAQHRFF